MTGSFNGSSGGPQPGDNNQQQQQQQSPPPSNGGGQPDWEAFSRSIESMGDTLGQRLTQELGGRLDNLRQQVADSTPEPAPVDPNAGFDFDAATPRQLYDHMTQQFSDMMENTIAAVIEQALGPYAQEITGIRRDLATDQGTREIDRLSAANKDFADWVPEMKAASAKHPSLSITEVYNLVKASDPMKADELGKKYNPPPPPPPRPFSLGPSSTQGNNSQQPKVMDKNEAALDAWNQVNQRHPGVLAALDARFPGM